jgi:hypothetical protein
LRRFLTRLTGLFSLDAGEAELAWTQRHSVVSVEESKLVDLTCEPRSSILLARVAQISCFLPIRAGFAT